TRRHAESVTRRTAPMMTRRADQLRMLQRYGPVFLSDDEYARRRAVVLGRYARQLARHPARFGDSQFRAFHASVPRSTSDGSLELGLLARGVLLAARRLATGRRENGADWPARRLQPTAAPFASSKLTSSGRLRARLDEGGEQKRDP